MSQEQEQQERHPKIFSDQTFFLTKNREKTELLNFQNWQGQMFYLNWSLTLKTKSCQTFVFLATPFQQKKSSSHIETRDRKNIFLADSQNLLGEIGCERFLAHFAVLSFLIHTKRGEGCHIWSLNLCKKKNYETYYRSARVQLNYFKEFFNYMEQFSWVISVYIGQS